MKFLKGLLIFIVVVAVILVAVTFFLPSKVTMERSTVIDASPEMIFDQVNNLKNWDNWSPWHQLDPDMTVEYSSENPAGVGEWYSWSGNDQVGSGKLTILESNPHSNIRSEMLFQNSEDPAFANMTFEETEEGTKVTWFFDAEMSGIGKWFGLMMDSFLGPQYEQGLNNLDSVVTNLPEKMPAADVESFEFQDTWYIGYIIKTDMDGVSDSSNYAKGLGAVDDFIQQRELEAAGPPMSIVHKFEPQNVVLEMAIPVADSIAVPDSLTLGKIPAGRALKMKHMGDYQNLADTWQAFDEYNAANEIMPRWYPYEVYVTDPSQEPDTSKWVTEIVFPVE